MPNPIFVALDTQDLTAATDLAKKLSGSVGGIKLGLEFFSANGPDGVREIAKTGVPVFLDLKFHDIPNTVAGAVRAAMSVGPSILNVHAAGGEAMMKAAAEALDEATTATDCERPLLIAVTVLTSLDQSDLVTVGQSGTPEEQVVRLARLTQASGLDGVVCSPREIGAIRDACGADFKLIVPGIRPEGSDTGDQKRTLTPKQAIDAGADYLVIGRPITAASDPAVAAKAIAASITP
ncbi:MAG TPA: orotidine-5'-phosphate decarboxylase [Rhodospirillaceae bacterium]|nr:orotidine-5'-phosphate decarboxylase [Rhodospirillaceae bacterium]HAA92775.1 orotidine-5'-phosphate decarboxylase [Rhodospirillaceae bacterium]HAT35773.1 orotidine-5'-phosphate decarboxylase [Rhodospirillaceae bacterium]